MFRAILLLFGIAILMTTIALVLAGLREDTLPALPLALAQPPTT